MTLEADIAQQAGLFADLQVCTGLQGAIEAVATHRLVHFAGIGSSRHVAGFGAACVELMAGLPAVLMASPGAAVARPAIRAGELLVVVSQSGQTPALVELAGTARAAGATVIVLTNTPGSALSSVAHLVVPCGAGSETVVPATKSVTVMMLQLRAMCGPIDPAARNRLSQLTEHLVSDPLVAELAARHPLPGLVVAGGFAAEWVADEVAIKLAEVSAHLAVAESVVDFLHGPAAVPAATLAFLDPDDPNTPAVLARPQVLTVGPDDSYDLTLARTGEPALDAIAAVVAGQVLALEWSRAHGIDPDDPRGLQKVTLTR